MIFRLLEKICKSLNEKEIPYMLSGSVAMNTYATPRMTSDIDIVINLKLSDLDNFSEIFKEGYYFYEEGVSEEIKRSGMFNVIDLESSQKVDFIIRKNTEFHINEFERRKKTDVYGFDVWIVSIEDLIISKLLWIQQLESDTQKRDIANLLENPSADKQYVKDWCKNLNLKTYNLI